MAGLKFIPLRSPGGETTSHIGLFVKIEIKALRHTQASPGGSCKQDLDSSIQKFSLSALPEVCHLSESLEAAIAVDHNNEGVDQGIPPQLVSDHSANGGHLLLPRLFRQDGINELTVDVHEENNAEEDTDIDTEQL